MCERTATRGGAYLDWRQEGAFLDAAISYSHPDLNARRDGVVDTLRANPNGWTLTAQARGGWLAGFGRWRAGPIAKLGYSRTHIEGFTERGDPLLTQDVAGTTDKSLVGGVGGRVETAGNGTLGAFLELSANHDFEDGRRTLLTANTYALDLPIYTVIPPAWGGRTGSSMRRSPAAWRRACRSICAALARCFVTVRAAMRWKWAYRSL